jgi:hypothetical protein
LDAVGVPDSRPVVVLKLAHVGRFTMLKVSALPLASAAVGVNEYALPTATDVAGEPDMVGGVLVDPADTLIVKPGNQLPPVASYARI